MKPKLVDQSVLAVYFDKDGVVSQLAHYTLQDGKVFDMISRTTPTGGKELTFLGQLLGNGIGTSDGEIGAGQRQQPVTGASSDALAARPVNKTRRRLRRVFRCLWSYTCST